MKSSLNRWLGLLLLGLLAILGQRYPAQWDWTANQRFSLSAVSLAVLAQLPEPLQVTAYIPDESGLRAPVQALLARYQQHKANLSVQFIDPDSIPGEARAQGIQAGGELFLRYQTRSARVGSFNEAQVSRALQQLVRHGAQSIRFLEGHGERDPQGAANFDLGYWGEHLRSQGLLVEPLNLAQAGSAIPADTSVLVIAGPRLPLTPAENAAVRAYVAAGGNLLWLLDPSLGNEEAWQGLQDLAQSVGLNLYPGRIVDPGSQRLFGAHNETLVLVERYPAHPATTGLDKARCLFPEAAALSVIPVADWTATPLLTTSAEAWIALGELGEQAPVFQAGRDIQGPVTLGFALERQVSNPARQQRLLVIGDGDFLSNSYLENGANLEAGLKFINWLSASDPLLSLPARLAPDAVLTLSSPVQLAMALLFLGLLPLALLGTGIWIWWWRKRA